MIIFSGAINAVNFGIIYIFTCPGKIAFGDKVTEMPIKIFSFSRFM